MLREVGIWTLIGFLGAAQASAVGIALLSTRGARRRLFGLLLLLLGGAMGVVTLSHLPIGRGSLVLVLLEDVASLWAPVVFFLFVELAFRGASRLGALRLHFVVPALFSLYGTAMLLGGWLTPSLLPRISWIVGFQVAYTSLATWRAFRVPAAGDSLASEVRLARWTIGLFWLIHAAQMVRFSTDQPAWRDIVPITAAAVAFAITFLAARESRVFAAVGDAARGRKYKSSSLSDEQAARGLAKLRTAMEVDRAYLRNDLTLVQLAEELGLPRNQLSQIVNERCGLSFSEFLNDYRVSEAERLMLDPGLGHVTVDAVGDRSGFNSRSAFYSAFKRRTGLTPAAFRRRPPGSHPRAASPTESS